MLQTVAENPVGIFITIGELHSLAQYVACRL
jgi:hypothetical protein